MNLKRLYEILNETTAQLRKGDVIHGTPELVDAIKSAKEADDFRQLPGGVVSFDMMPHVSEAGAGTETVDCEFIVVAVDKAKAEEHRAELIEILRTYPRPKELAGGPSYITVGGEIGDQGAAFQLFALGKVLKLWDIITPKSLGFSGEEARDMAGRGLVMITGFRQ